MKKRILLTAVLLAAISALGAGCRLSREPQPAAPEVPLPYYVEPAPVEPLSPPVETTPVIVPQEIDIFDSLDSLSAALGEARKETAKEEFDRLLEAAGPLAVANLSLSLLEAALPETAAMQRLYLIQELVAEQDFEGAAKRMDELILYLEPLMAGLNAGDAVTIASLQNALNALLAKDAEKSARLVGNLIEALAKEPELREIREIRFDIYEARAAAERKRGLILEGLLEDAVDRTVRLKDILRESADSIVTDTATGNG